MSTPVSSSPRCKRPRQEQSIPCSPKRVKLTPNLTTVPDEILNLIFTYTLASTPDLKLVSKRISRITPPLPTTFIGRFRWLVLSSSVRNKADRLYLESLSGLLPTTVRNESNLSSTFSSKCLQLYKHEVKLENLSKMVNDNRIRVIAEVAGSEDMELLPLLIKAIPPLQRQAALNEALWLAALKGKIQACRLLLENRADPLWEKDQDDTPFSAASAGHHTGILMEFFKATVGERRHQPDWQPKINQALWAAVSKQPRYQDDISGEKLSTKMLLLAKANPLAQRKNGSVLICHVATLQKLSLLKIFHGSVPDEQKKGPTWQKVVDRGLVLAIKRKDENFAEMLIDEGANPKWKLWSWQTARELAKRVNNKRLMALLRSPIKVK